ncbi:MAG: DUF1963 domain-containing protein [Erythrobacter sp.]|uniref:DUF1963 domain-containing protein n=1 Tax=Erythrobacter sp. TaxID=1042 RepID=UPI003267A6F9
MRFDLLLAMFSSGLYAALALMAGGFILAVGGLAVLLWRRKSLMKPSLDEAAHNALEAPNSEESEAPFAAPHADSPVPAVPEGRRRRSLVGGAERESGTPAGDQLNDVEELPEDRVMEDDALIDDSSPSDTQDEAYEAEDVAISSGEHIVSDEVEGAFEEEALEAEFSEIETETGTSEEELDEANDAELEDRCEVAVPASVPASASAATADSVTAFATNEPEPSDDETLVSESPIVTQGDPIEFEPPMPAEVSIARGNPIVFRQFVPQSIEADGLSFFGGQPIGPEDFQWPRERGAQGGAPLQFVMQWDCSHLSKQDPTGLLPQEGLLYCFINNAYDGDDDFLSSHTFIHHRGPVRTWKPVPLPKDAGPALGKDSASLMSGCTGAIENGNDFAPRTLPRFPFASIALKYPNADADAGIAWSQQDISDALLDIQKNGVALKQLVDDGDSPRQDHARPFPTFPHDFGAIRVIASRMIAALDQPDRALAEALYPGLSNEDLEAQFAGWREEAKEVYLLGTQRSAEERLDQSIADDIWQWFNERSSILGSEVSSVFEEAVDLSLGIGSDAFDAVPARWIDEAMHLHALATECEVCEQSGKGHVLAQTPVRMFGPPSETSGVIVQRANQDILLLELPSGAGPHHKFGGRVLQYWISPDDLAAGNFDQVAVTIA